MYSICFCHSHQRLG